MSACAMLTYNGVSEAAWNCGVQKAKQYGVDITTDKGNASVSGFTVAWNYDRGAQTLQLQCTDSPWIVPCSLINSKINDAVTDCLKQHNVALSAMV